MDDRNSIAQAKAAVLQAMKRFALEQSVEDSVNVNTEAENAGRQTCAACGSSNRKGNKFCASCGVALPKGPELPDFLKPGPAAAAEPPGDHHYHHHYHHHYFNSSNGSAELGLGPDQRAGASAAPPSREVARVRPSLTGASLSRAEMALRRVSQDWALACNTKQLDDLVDLYIPDATVLRANVPAVRGTAAIREFFFGVLDAGMSEVEMEPVRSELFGDYGYEAGRFKSLVPSSVGKRREERGKYLLMLNRQANGDWKVVADSWSSDLSLGATAESPVKPIAGSGTPLGGQPRKP
jgi:ketosteroid isomerase-like protein